MTIAYWILATPLALFHLYAGALKSARTRDRLRPMMAWVDTVPMPAVRTIGALELLGAAGLSLPPLTGVAPWLALFAAIGFAALQLAASALHLHLGDRRIALNATLFTLAAAAIRPATTWL
ncbi:DoxX family protein [Streptomyces niveiscabiei]|uniref:DoxX family protein n=1 Tax=Streptomyces niveiscabiei TaxID=164115 RepID=UPI0029B1B735|nr:DoxX family protein [Streptomyces niveiscabiei]MDX3380557.1 DoxX family protein [Streptomyces niveiscabiei]